MAKEKKIKKKVLKKKEVIVKPIIKVKTEKEILLELYQNLKDRGIGRISDLENLIARAE